MSQYRLLIDSKKCNGCYNCFMSCKDEHEGNENLPYSHPTQPGTQLLKVSTLEHGSGDKVKVDFYPTLCKHCENPPCATVAPKGGVKKESNGIVTFHSEALNGCEGIVNACPHGAIHWNETLQQPQKCTLCAHMLEEGESLPRCVESCPTGAMQLERLETSAPMDVVQYINLPRPFLAGELLSHGDGTCVSDATVTLNQGGDTLHTQTNLFGDFQFLNLSLNVSYTLAITVPGYQDKKLDLVLTESTNLGEIVLHPK